MTEQFFLTKSHSLAKKYLTKTLFKKLRNKKTSSGYTISNAINSGISNPDSDIGIYAGDAESYEVFSEIFDPVIEEYHSFTKEKNHINDFSFSSLKPLDPENKYIISTRIRVARNLDGFPFTPFISRDQRNQVEQSVLQATTNLPKELQGMYFPLKTIFKSDVEFLKSSYFPKKGDRFQKAAGIMRDFPDSRGVFLADNQEFMIWINEEDHLRIISMDSGSDLAGTFNRLCLGINALEKDLKFSISNKYGYLTSCPSNIGTSMRASVHIKLPGINQQKELMNKIAKQYGLQIRGTSGEKSSIEKSVFDISNKHRLGVTEHDCLALLSKGIQELIEIEKKLIL
jgi:arginine kinase